MSFKYKRLFQKQKISGKKCTFSGRVYKSVLKSRIVHQKKCIHEEVHFANMIFLDVQFMI